MQLLSACGERERVDAIFDLVPLDEALRLLELVLDDLGLALGSRSRLAWALPPAVLLQSPTPAHPVGLQTGLGMRACTGLPNPAGL